MKRLLLLILFPILIITQLYAQKSVTLIADSLNVLHKDEFATIELPEKPANGYTWHCVFVDSSYSECLGKVSEKIVGRKEENKDKIVKHLFEFQTYRKGKIILLFELYRDWEGREFAIQQKSVPVLVKENVEAVATRGIGNPQKMYDWADTDTLNFQNFHAGATFLRLQKNYEMPIGQIFLIDLENRIQGATWIAHISNPSVVELVQDRMFSRSQIAYSMYSLHAFKFIARRKGMCNIRFDLILPDGEIAQSKILNYQVLVKDDTFESEIEAVENGVNR